MMFKISDLISGMILNIGYNVPEKGYISRIRYRGRKSPLAIRKGSHHNPRRWVVERTNSWHSGLRKLSDMKKIAELSFISRSSFLYHHP
jgi:hypothetical protein